MPDTQTKAQVLAALKEKVDSYEERLTASGNISKAIQHFLKERREDIEKQERELPTLKNYFVKQQN